MKFYFYGNDGTRRELTQEETRKHLSDLQIQDAIDAKRTDPCEQVSYMAVGGFIVLE